MYIKAVIFDMDGLMLDTEKLYVRFWCEAANQLGFPMEEHHALSIRSMAAKYAIPKLKGYFGDSFDYAQVRSKRIELMNQYIEENGIDKKKGIEELLKYLKDHGYKIAVATASDMERTKKYLTRAGLFSYFDKVVCAFMVESGKPAPDIYEKAAEELGEKPQHCIALEDSPNGILAAYRAGCVPIMIPDLDEPDEDTKEILFDMKENLLQVIDVLEQTPKEGYIAYQERVSAHRERK